MTGAPGLGAWRAAGAVAAKELRTEARARSAAQGVALFAALVVLLFSFALGPDTETLRRLAAGLLWMAIALASLLAVGRTFAAEEETGTLQGLLLHPVRREAIFLGKALATFVLLVAVAAAALVLMAALYSLPGPGSVALVVATLVAGCAGLAVAGTFYGAVSASLRAREALVPVLLLPILVPLVIAATQATAAGLGQGGEGWRWLGLLAAFDVAITTLTVAVFPYVVER